jgi:hypothetical protein
MRPSPHQPGLHLYRGGIAFQDSRGDAGMGGLPSRDPARRPPPGLGSSIAACLAMGSGIEFEGLQSSILTRVQSEGRIPKRVVVPVPAPYLTVYIHEKLAVSHTRTQSIRDQLPGSCAICWYPVPVQWIGLSEWRHKAGLTMPQSLLGSFLRAQTRAGSCTVPRFFFCGREWQTMSLSWWLPRCAGRYPILRLRRRFSAAHTRQGLNQGSKDRRGIGTAPHDFTVYLHSSSQVELGLMMH